MRATTICLLASILVICASCKEDYNKRVARIVSEWHGKQFFLTDSVETRINRCAPCDYVLVSYMDETICNSCRVNSWKKYVSQLNEDTLNHISTLLIISPDAAKNIDTATCALKNGVYHIDTDNTICTQNSIPKEDELRTFLLDKKRNVVAIGNPLFNNHVHQLFLKKIRNNE